MYVMCCCWESRDRARPPPPGCLALHCSIYKMPFARRSPSPRRRVQVHVRQLAALCAGRRGVRRAALPRSHHAQVAPVGRVVPRHRHLW